MSSKLHNRVVGLIVGKKSVRRHQGKGWDNEAFEKLDPEQLRSE
jgi:hypothetical protein